MRAKLNKLRALLGLKLNLSKPATLKLTAKELGVDASTLSYWMKGRGCTQENEIRLNKAIEKLEK